MPQAIFQVAWVVMALGYTYSGYTKLISPSWLDGTAMARILDNPLARSGPIREALLALPNWCLRLGTWTALSLELAFAPLALVRRLRPWLWGIMLTMHLSLLVLIDFADLSLGMAMLHLFTFDPGWIRPRQAPTDMLFYDGGCGLCHRLVRFVLAEDPTGKTFRFAPLEGDAFSAAIPGPGRPNLPDSLILLTADGVVRTRSGAVLHVLRRLGGIWRLFAGPMSVIPVPWLDKLYDGIAGIRHQLFRTPATACPLVPPELRARFEL